MKHTHFNNRNGFGAMYLIVTELRRYYPHTNQYYVREARSWAKTIRKSMLPLGGSVVLYTVKEE